MVSSATDPPLKGTRVLDLTRVLSGPFCSMILSDLGAEIIKIEIPTRGDDTRAYPPFIEGVSSYFLSLNRGKKSLTLNLKTPEGVKILHKLVANSDIVLENFRPGVTKRLGVDYDALKQIKEDIIYCSISSFGQTGPYATWPGYDLIVQGMSGLMGITGEQDSPPVKVGIAVTDINAGLHAVISILAALKVRDQHGVGQHLDVSMLDSAVSWLTFLAGSYFTTDKVPQRMGNAHPSIVPYQSFQAGDDKHLLIAAGNDRLYRTLCEVLGLVDLVEDVRFSTNGARIKNRTSLIPLIQEELSKKPRDVWLKELREAGFPCAPVYSIEEVFEDPQVKHRGMITTIQHPKAGEIKQIGTPFKTSVSKIGLTIPPPLLGEHTYEILRELCNYTAEEITILKQKGVI